MGATRPAPPYHPPENSTKQHQEAPKSAKQPATAGNTPIFKRISCGVLFFSLHVPEDGENTNWKTATKNNKH